jgi:hypothetical protein
LCTQSRKQYYQPTEDEVLEEEAHHDEALLAEWQAMTEEKSLEFLRGDTTMAHWIDGDYPLKHIGFLIEKSNPIRHTEHLELAQRPAHTNQSHAPKLYGWCGSWNDTNTYALGIARVSRVAGNGRVQVTEVVERAEVQRYLEEVGYPDLLDAWDKAQAPRA